MRDPEFAPALTSDATCPGCHRPITLAIAMLSPMLLILGLMREEGAGSPAGTQPSHEELVVQGADELARRIDLSVDLAPSDSEGGG